MEDSLHRDVYWLLRKTAMDLKTEMREKVLDYGITWPQFHALYHIHDDDGTPSHELARELQCNASNLTGLIDRMEGNGWVYRQRSSEDRRVWFVKLTEEGKEMKRNTFPQHRAYMKERMDVLTEEELRSLKTLLQKLKDGNSKESSHERD